MRERTLSFFIHSHSAWGQRGLLWSPNIKAMSSLSYTQTLTHWPVIQPTSLSSLAFNSSAYCQMTGSNGREWGTNMCEVCWKEIWISDAIRKWNFRSSLMRWKAQILICRNAGAKLFLFFSSLIMLWFWCACGICIPQTLLNFPLQFPVNLFAPGNTSSCS